MAGVTCSPAALPGAGGGAGAGPGGHPHRHVCRAHGQVRPAAMRVPAAALQACCAAGPVFAPWAASATPPLFACLLMLPTSVCPCAPQPGEARDAGQQRGAGGDVPPAVPGAAPGLGWRLLPVPRLDAALTGCAETAVLGVIGWAGDTQPLLYPQVLARVPNAILRSKFGAGAALLCGVVEAKQVRGPGAAVSADRPAGVAAAPRGCMPRFRCACRQRAVAPAPPAAAGRGGGGQERGAVPGPAAGGAQPRRLARSHPPLQPAAQVGAGACVGRGPTCNCAAAG